MASELNELTFGFEPKNSIPAGGQILITIPSGVSFESGNATNDTSVSIFGTNQSGFTVNNLGNILAISGLFNA